MLGEVFVTAVSQVRVAGTEVRGGDPDLGEGRHVRPPDLGLRSLPRHVDQAGDHRMSETGTGGRGPVQDFDVVVLVQQLSQVAPQPLQRILETAVGGDAMVEHARRGVGHDVGGDAALDADGLELFDEHDAVDLDLSGLVGRDEGQQVAQAMNGVSPHVGARRVGALAPQAHLHPQRPLTARLHTTVGRFGQDGHVGGQQVGSQLGDLEQAALRPGNLLAGVEDPGHLHGTRFRAEGEVEHGRDRTLHVAGAHPVQHAIVEPRRRGVAGDGVEVPRD